MYTAPRSLIRAFSIRECSLGFGFNFIPFRTRARRPGTAYNGLYGDWERGRVKKRQHEDTLSLHVRVAENQNVGEPENYYMERMWPMKEAAQLTKLPTEYSKRLSRGIWTVGSRHQFLIAVLECTEILDYDPK